MEEEHRLLALEQIEVPAVLVIAWSDFIPMSFTPILLCQVEVKAVMSSWTLRPGSGSQARPRSVPELLGALPGVLGDVLPEGLSAGLRTLCNVSPPADVSPVCAVYGF